MIAACALLLIGLADVIRTHAAQRLVVGLIAVVWIGVIAGSVVLVGVPIIAIGVSIALGIVWLATMTAAESRRPPAGVWPAVALAAVLLLLLAIDRSSAGVNGPLVDALAGSASPIVRGTPAPVILLIMSCAIFLIESGNIITRAALYRDGFRSAAEPEAELTPTSRWPRRGGRLRSEHQNKPIPDLKGGRSIGPLERLAIAGLVLVGAYAIVGAVLAGKGIVRFPEISKDSTSGSKAEYFLVGSLSSWAIALAVAGYVALAR